MENPILDTAADQIITRNGEASEEAPLPTFFFEDNRGTHVSLFTGGSASEPADDPEALALYQQGLALLQNEEDTDRHRKAALAFGAAYQRQPFFLKALLNYAGALINAGSDLRTAETLLQRGLALVGPEGLTESEGFTPAFRKAFARMARATLGSMYLELAEKATQPAQRSVLERMSDIEHRLAVQLMEEELAGLLAYAAVSALAVGDRPRAREFYRRAQAADPNGKILDKIVPKFSALEKLAATAP